MIDVRHTGEKVTMRTPLASPGDCQVGRAIGGGLARSRKDTRGMGAVTATSTRANNGDWTGRIMTKPASERGRRPVTVTRLSPRQLAARRKAAGLPRLAA